MYCGKRERERDGKGKAQTFSFVLGRAKRQTFLLNRVVVSGKAKINKSGKNISTVVLFVMNTFLCTTQICKLMRAT